ncbi:MAG: beta-ketoacyl synthase N-terminal-like domain-containing protein [Anaerolineaceae bacterium]|nr:beta-ketoacyl synthase N-terminal-like domain-containing protein [Anaerolineaceae bacterium]MDD4043621.1 beta-ketoacyl synthase N-terminal-like domain-containing protein [Anaerolineaceae bacterium]MDD4577256.1 beta-ketoacyl synthase N-terminal-like domain-containing protein [Anaerolineaceae bacterium]
MEATNDVYIVGIGQTAVGELWDVSLRTLAVRALRAAREDAGGLQPQAIFVGNMLAANASHQSNLGALIAEYAGLAGKAEGFTAEAAEASGGAAIYLAYNAIRSGMVDVAAVVGVEKVTDVVGAGIENRLLSAGLDSDYEASEGLTLTGQTSLLLQRYLYENQFPREALAHFPMIAHSNAVNNPNAMYRRTIEIGTYRNAREDTGAFNQFDIAPNADGAAALILTRQEYLPENLAHTPVRLLGSSLITDRLALHDRPDPLFFEAAAVSVQHALLKAGITLSDLDFFEYSDNTTLHALLSLEAAGFASRGQGWKLASDGSLTLQGSLPVATMGGHKARGFPLGASGVYQVVEASQQLRGEAGANQISHVRFGMTQSLAASASAAATQILSI